MTSTWNSGLNLQEASSSVPAPHRPYFIGQNNERLCLFELICSISRQNGICLFVHVYTYLYPMQFCLISLWLRSEMFVQLCQWTGVQHQDYLAGIPFAGRSTLTGLFVGVAQCPCVFVFGKRVFDRLAYNVCTRSHIAHTVACISYFEYPMNMIFLIYIYITEQSFFLYHSISIALLHFVVWRLCHQNESAVCSLAIGDPFASARFPRLFARSYARWVVVDLLVSRLIVVWVKGARIQRSGSFKGTWMCQNTLSMVRRTVKTMILLYTKTIKNYYW